MSVGRDSSLLLIVDDWEALERYEERLSSHFTELEACPMPALNRTFTTYSLTPDRTAQKQAAE